MAVCAAATTLAGGATAAERSVAPEARIPFAGNIRDFQPDGTRAIYVQDSHRRWYRGTFMAPCLDLPYAETIGVRNRGIGGLDKWATIYVRGSRCTLSSFVRSGPPGPKPKRAPSAAL
jgi:hypothetical protein